MSTPNGFSDNPLCAEMERRCTDMLLVSQAVVTCADVFEQACEPRAPKPEWFGTGPGQWDSWWILMKSDGRTASVAHRSLTYHNAYVETIGNVQFLHSGTSKYVLFNGIELALPVTKESTPGFYAAPVGWKVVSDD